MESWPTSILPAPKTSLAGQADTNALRLEMEAGTIRQRRLFSESRVVISVEWSFTQQEHDIFIAFLKFKLADGSDSFLWNLDLGGGAKNHELRFLDGKYTATFDEVGFWVVSAQLETILNAGFCTPNLTGFLTNPMGAVDLSAYFGPQVCSPLAATAWRLHTDDCGYNIEYFLGAVNDNGTLNPGTNVIIDPGTTGTGWNSSDLSFWSAYGYPEGMYLQVQCGGLWSNRPCIAGGNGSPP